MILGGGDVLMVCNQTAKNGFVIFHVFFANEWVQLLTFIYSGCSTLGC